MGIDRRRMTGNYFPLRDAMDRLFESSFIAPQGLTGQYAFPSVNVHASDDDIIVDMAVPGATPDDINISVTGDTLTVSGEVKREERGSKGQTYLEEMYHGQFQRSFSLPFPVDAGNANATFENGILRLTLPKSEAIKPRRIQVNQQGAGSPGRSSQ